MDYDPGDGKSFQNVHTKKWQTAEERDKIEARKKVHAKATTSSDRPMANGPRRGPLTNVSADEQRWLLSEAEKLGIPKDVLSFNTGRRTSFDDDLNIIHIRGDVFPSDFAANPGSILNARCALAHEYYGHYMHHDTFAPGDWRDEFQASYRAALDTPNLTDSERSMLMIDAFDRAREANVSVFLNEEARRIVYGSK